MCQCVCLQTNFNHEFNISIHPNLTDTCKTCNLPNAKIKAAANENDASPGRMQLELHQQKADNARYGLQNDSALTKTDNHVSVLTFDLLTTPVISTGICYYKRQLWTYNLHIHCMNNDTVFMYLWDESTASRGADEAAATLLLHIKNHVKMTRLICYSDCCGGQNRNIQLALMWNYTYGQISPSLQVPISICEGLPQDIMSSFAYVL